MSSKKVVGLKSTMVASKMYKYEQAQNESAHIMYK